MKHNKSGPAIFMYTVIVIMLLVSCACFGLHYIKFPDNGIVLWIGITSFMIVYHFWLRLIMGNVTKLFKINYNHRWFKERFFEKKLYEILKVKRWKKKALTYNPEAFSLKKNTLEEIADTMAKSEVDHWINELISVSAIFFSFVWGKFYVFLITSVAAMIFDAQFIIIQRYNRPKVLRIIKKRINRKKL